MSKQDYIDHVIGSLPHWFVENERIKELIQGFAEMYCRAEEQSVFFQQMSFIDQAFDGPPDWLNQHAIDRGLLRQGGETNPALRDRIRGLDDAVNYPSVLAAAQAIIDAAGIVGDVHLLELRENRAFYLTRGDQSGTGGQFTDLNDGADGFAFEPTSGITISPTSSTTANSFILEITGANSPDNDGQHVVDGAYLTGPSYNDPTGVAEADPTVTWSMYQANASGTNTSNFKDAFFMDHTDPNACGFRMSNSGATLVVILPFGCTQTTLDAITELLYNIKGAGVQLLVECRQNP